MPHTAFYQLVDKYFDEFKRVYPRRYRSDFGPWRPVGRSSSGAALLIMDLPGCAVGNANTRCLFPSPANAGASARPVIKNGP